MGIEVGSESYVPVLALLLLVFVGLYALRPVLFEAYLRAKDLPEPESSDFPVSFTGYTMKLLVRVKLRNATLLWGERALNYLLEKGRVPVLKPTRGDRPDHYDPVGWGLENGEAVFYFDVPVDEWYLIWPTDCYLCTIKVTRGCTKGATFIEAKGIWVYPID